MADRTPPTGLPRARRFLLSLVLLGAVGCVPKVKGIDLRPPEIDLPASFGDDLAGENDLEDLRADAVFQDPHLVALIDEALRHNQELGMAAMDIHVHNAAIMARRGEVFPTVGLGIGAGVEKVGRYTSQGAADAAVEMEPGREVPEHLGSFQIALKASWEIDIWKKLRNATQAARARWLQSIEGRTFLSTGLVAEIAHAYYELVSLDRQLAVLDQNVALIEEAIPVVQMQKDAARATSLAVQRFDAELLRAQARRYAVAQAIVEAENHLNALVGRYPQPIDRDVDRFVSMPLASMTAGLPAQMMTRRPDIRAAEQALAASELDVKVARARFFPSLSIDARFGIDAFNPVKFAALPASLMYDVVGQLMAPLFNRSELKAEYHAANAEQMKAVLEYEQTTLFAFVDIDKQLAAIEKMDHRQAHKARQVERLEEAVDTSNQLFRAARADYLEVLTTRREALEAELELAETRLSQVGARIDLYRALGGGWPEPGPLPDTTLASTHVEGGR